jgi:hypothetical protein
MKPVTIDNLSIKIHERYAQDQSLLDPKYITESHSVTTQSEITGTSSIYTSKLEALFEFNLKNCPWASFSPPPRFLFQARRFFSFSLFPYLSFGEEKEREDDEEENEERKEANDLIERARAVDPGKEGSSSAFEKERTSILNLLDTLKHLNGLLKHINARKAQYQKG